jgi:hypothetical protein
MPKKHKSTVCVGSFCPCCGEQLQKSGHCIECDTTPEHAINCWDVDGVISLEIPDVMEYNP